MPARRPSVSDSPRLPEPGEVLAGSIGFLLSKLGALTATRFAGALEQLGIAPVHFALLRIIDASGSRSQQALGEALSIPPSRMVGLVDDMEGRGLLERRRNPNDRRVNTVHLTAAGRQVLRRAMVIGTEWENRLCASLDPTERAELVRLLRRLAADHDLPIGVHPALAHPAEPPDAPPPGTGVRLGSDP
jgi:DNA-binding MarR family transcriptional regulator